MLVCDDKAGSLKSQMVFYDMRSFENPKWDCANGEAASQGAFF
jgi:hypothetical protein